jgi:hypothetical protein
VFSSELVVKNLKIESLGTKIIDGDSSHGLEPLARIALHRLLIDQQAMGALKILETSKVNAYKSNCYRLRLLQVVLLFVAAYRALDIFLVGFSNSPMGLSGVTGSKRSAEHNKRLILTTFLGVIELVFWYGIILFGIELLGYGQFKESFFSNGDLATAPVRALQTSMSTITTIGYGTYAPNCWLTTLICFSETLTGIILLTMVASSAISLSNDDISITFAESILGPADKPEEALGGLISKCWLLAAIFIVLAIFVLPILFFILWTT